MTQVLIAVDDSDTSVSAARVAYGLFGDSATYTVVNVADRSPMMWGGDALVWGIGYPIVMTPSATGGVVPRTESPEADQRDSEPTTAPSDAAITVSAVDSASIDAAMKVARDVAAEAALPNPQVVGEVGDPALAIMSAARHHRADVIVIGSHERSWFSRLFIPSVAGTVMREADIPVLIAR